MTTAWSWVARGNLLRAGQASVGGTVLALTAVIAGPWLVWSGVRGHRVHWPLGDWTTIGMLVGFFLLTLIDWGCRLFFAGR